jgi:hypothetical protein
MDGPEKHLDYHRERHANVLRLARTGELAARIANSRDEERRSFLARLRLRREAVRPATST